MKRVIKQSLAVAMLMYTTTAFSNEKMWKAKSGSGNNTLVHFEEVNKGSTLYIKDKNDAILYQEKISKSGTYTKKFDLTNIPDAHYYFEIKQHDEVQIIPFVVQEKIAKILKDSMYSFVRPEITVNNNHVHILNHTKDLQNLEIRIYYENDDLVYTELLKNINELNRVFDFSTSSEGNYTIVMEQYGKMFNQSKVYYKHFINQ